MLKLKPSSRITLQVRITPSQVVSFARIYRKCRVHVQLLWILVPCLLVFTPQIQCNVTQLTIMSLGICDMRGPSLHQFLHQTFMILGVCWKLAELLVFTPQIHFYTPGICGNHLIKFSGYTCNSVHISTKQQETYW